MLNQAVIHLKGSLAIWELSGLRIDEEHFYGSTQKYSLIALTFTAIPKGQ
jgi:hypothetical protein